MQIDFERAFEVIAAAMVRAAKDCSFSTASAEAERLGLIEQGDGKPSQLHVWERCEKAMLFDSNGAGMTSRRPSRSSPT